MKIIKAAATHIPHNCSPEQFIERIGRICYKSESKTTDDSASKFVEGLIKRKHWAMLEHEIAYMIVDKRIMQNFWDMLRILNISTEFLDTTYLMYKDYCILSGNIRAFYDIFKAYQTNYLATFSEGVDCIINMVKNFYPWAFKDIKEPLLNKEIVSEYCHIFSRDEFINFCNKEDKENKNYILFRHLNHTVKFTIDRGVTHEFCRHRRMAYAMESTRYCNYSKGQFGNEITIIEPLFYKSDSKQYKLWKNGCENSEKIYLKLLQNGASPQQARTNLVNSTKADLIMTATEEEWQHFINLRSIGTTGTPHPQAREVADIWARQLINITDNRIKYNIK